MHKHTSTKVVKIEIKRENKTDREKGKTILGSKHEIIMITKLEVSCKLNTLLCK